MKKHIPNLFTLCSLFFGCCAIVYCFQVEYYYNEESEISNWIIFPEKIYLSALFIGLAAIIDFLDGFIARWLQVSSELGKQLDSLADVVSFGVAPSMIVYKFLAQSNQSFFNDGFVPFIALAPAFLIAVAAAYRLGKFNILSNDNIDFMGVPTPAIGILTASFPIIFWTNKNIQIFKILNSPFFWYLFIILVSILMIANIPILSLKKINQNKTKKIIFIALISIGFIGVFLIHWLIIPILFFLYLIASIVYFKLEVKS